MMSWKKNMPSLWVQVVLLLIASVFSIGLSSPLEKELKKVHLKDAKETSIVEQRSVDKSSTKDAKTRKTQTERDTTVSNFNGLVLTDALFSYGDVNKDGHLTLEEIFNFYKNIIGFIPNLAESTAANLILIGDKNKDGVLDWTEVMEAIELMKKEMSNNGAKTQKL